MTKYKFLRLEGKKIKSQSGDKPCYWKVGEWKKEDRISMCNHGFHCSNTILDALSFVNGEVLAIVETKGQCETQSDKECWQEMQIVKAYNWTKKDSVALAIYSAELVLGNYEKEYPDDKRPRQAIQAAKKVLKNDNEKNRSAAESAARSARSAARSAAWSAAWSAESAAWSAESAESAAWSARSAAEEEAMLDKINTWIINHIKELKEYKGE